MSVRSPAYHRINGILEPIFFDAGSVRSAMEYVPNPGDLFITTYQKCGTTWMQHIVYLIQHRGKFPEDADEFYGSCPFMEMLGAEAVRNLRQPGSIKIHLPIHVAPFSTSAKYIYVLRNPRDCITSYYYHVKMMLPYKFDDGTIDDLFELFLKGEVENNDYFDHMLGWYARRNDPNFFFITYEDMKKNPKDCVLRVAKFMGKEYADMLSKEPEILDNVLRKSSIEFMKIHTNDYLRKLIKLPLEEIRKKPNAPKTFLNFSQAFPVERKIKVDEEYNFVRKGEVGDYKSHLSQEQVDRLNQRFAEKLKGVQIRASWESFGFS